MNNMFEMCRGDAPITRLSNKDLKEALEESTSSNPQLSFLDKSSYDKTLDVLAEAFLDDNLFTWVTGLNDLDLDDETKRERQFKLNRILIGWEVRPVLARKKGIAMGVRAAGSNDGGKEEASLAGAISLVPGRYKNNYTIVQTILNIISVGIPPFYTKEKEMYGPGADKRLDSMKALHDMKNKWMAKYNSNYVYIAQLGVLIKHQGKGLGGQLLRAVLNATDSLNVPTCLVTESKKNESMYQHFGFETMEVLDLEVDGTATKLPNYFMIRTPQGSGPDDTKD